MVLASEPVGGRSWVTELPCFKVWIWLCPSLFSHVVVHMTYCFFIIIPLMVPSHHDDQANVRLAFSIFWETLVSVHGRIPIARNALLTLLGCR